MKNRIDYLYIDKVQNGPWNFYTYDADFTMEKNIDVKLKNYNDQFYMYFIFLPYFTVDKDIFARPHFSHNYWKIVCGSPIVRISGPVVCTGCPKCCVQKKKRDLV